ncbi:MAG: hypothetical protein MUC54_08885, partial [Chloroflexi bacterium]|nr:hypothetical protein [Chloroflexota bacterium]
SWELVGTQATILVRMLADLPVEQGVPPQGGLGYRGFTVDIMTGGQVERLVVYRGAVAAEGSGARPVRLDPTRSVERYLLQSGRSQLDPAEAAAVEADLGGA